MHTHIRVHIFILTSIYMHTYTHAYTCLCTHAHTQVHTQIRIQCARTQTQNKKRCQNANTLITMLTNEAYQLHKRGVMIYDDILYDSMMIYECAQ